MLNKFTAYLFTIVIFFSSSLYANPDKGKPIFLESDSAKWDEDSQKSTYRGNVVVTPRKFC